jgi:4-hydroxy-2-oxoheptanedioate aldolase
MSYRSPLTSKICNPHLRLLNALRADLKPIMTFTGLSSFRTAQMVAQTGLDVSFTCLQRLGLMLEDIQAIIIDCEHGNISDDNMHSATAAVAAMGVSPLVRLRMAHPDLIKRALDTGAQ